MIQESQSVTTAVSAGTNMLLATAGVMTFNHWMTLIGVLCGVGTFGVNWYYKQREDKRREREASR